MNSFDTSRISVSLKIQFQIAQEYSHGKHSRANIGVQ
jgi:hypothetical protein